LVIHPHAGVGGAPSSTRQPTRCRWPCSACQLRPVLHRSKLLAWHSASLLVPAWHGGMACPLSMSVPLYLSGVEARAAVLPWCHGRGEPAGATPADWPPVGLPSMWLGRDPRWNVSQWMMFSLGNTPVSVPNNVLLLCMLLLLLRRGAPSRRRRRVCVGVVCPHSSDNAGGLQARAGGQG